MDHTNYADYVETLQHLSLEEIRAVLEVFQKATDSYIYIMDLDTDTYMTTSKMLTRFPFDNVVTMNATPALQKIIYPSDYPKAKEDIRKCAAGEQETHSLEYRWLDADRRIVWIDCRGTVIKGAGGHRLLVGRVTELGKEAKADNITGLRREVRFKYDTEEILRDRPETIKYMMRIGIDNFKEINEKEGVKAGDNVLRELADCIVASVDPRVDVYRLMADEFMLVDAAPTSDKDARTVYEEIKSRVTDTVRRKEYSCFYTISAGIMQNEFEDRSAEEILRLTEFALNEAKRNGRNQMALFDAEVYNGYLRRLDIRRLMRQDINNNFKGFQVFYQPIVSAPEYKIIGAEALLRWNCEKYGSVSPAVFIPILEESGLIIPVGKHVLWQAARTCKKWREILPGFHVHVNLSYVQMHKSDLLDDVDRCIKEVDIPPESLVLELTESGYIETDTRIMELFKHLKEKNIDLALDDFGTGYSNMRYLKEIEAKTVKIDRSFVVQALQNDHDYSIIKHIIDMVHSLGSSVCMEGIEEEDELDKMMKTKPDMIQGYYFGKPAPAEQFEERFLPVTDSL
ncbi:MAG: GGDEF and EAL domain-containing protein [Lachnospiraceae bacterium]|nr:GGDEF and EAL domain-containing protein [Lachnospiraceae bacterium]